MPAPVEIPQPAPPSTPSFLNRELPSVGLIIGPGGLKTYAALGVLREISRARIPIHSVVGLEWGALIAGLYAMQGQVNEAEWQAFKLKESDLPSGAGFFSSSTQPQSIGGLNGFLTTAFGNANVEKAKVGFACPAYWSKHDRMGWMQKGSMRDAVRTCLPYPPMYLDNSGVLAAPFAVQEAAEQLRRRGANLIVLVNVLGDDEFLPAKSTQQYVESVLWSELRREMLQAKSPYVHHVINVKTSGHSISDFQGRRSLLEAGVKAAKDPVEKMASKYGF